MVTLTSTGQRVLFGLLSAVFAIGLIGDFVAPKNPILECMHLAPYGLVTGFVLGAYAIPAANRQVRKGYPLALPIFVVLALSLLLSVSSAISKPSMVPLVAFSTAMIVAAVVGYRRTRQTVALRAA